MLKISMKIIVICLIICPLVLAKLPETGLVLHLDASIGIITDENNRILQWQDQSGQNNHAVDIDLMGQFEREKLPVLEQYLINGLPAARFDGVDDSLIIWDDSENLNIAVDPLGINGSDGLTIFIVAYLDNWEAPNQNNRIFGNTGTDVLDFIFTSDSRIAFSTSVASVWGDPAAAYTGSEAGIMLAGRIRPETANNRTQVEMWQNGQFHKSAYGPLETISSQSPKSVGACEYEGVSSNFFQGCIAEVIVYNRPLNDTEMNWLGCHLSRKYTIVTGYQSVETDIPQTDLVLHLKADVGVITGSGSTVIEWQDQSGQNNHAVRIDKDGQIPADKLPLIENSVMNGMPVLRFDGIDDNLMIWDDSANPNVNIDPLGLEGSYGATVFVVAYLDSGTVPDSTKRLFGNTGPDVFNIQFQTGGRSSFSNSVKVLWGDAAYPYNGSEGGIMITGRLKPDFVNDISLIELWQEGQAYSSRSSTLEALVCQSPKSVGACEYAGLSYNFFQGCIAEIIVYKRDLSEFDMNFVGDYLSQKYTLGANYSNPDASHHVYIQTLPPGINTVFPRQGLYNCFNLTTINLEAYPSASCPDTYILDNWSGGDILDQNAAFTKAIIRTNTTITANFTQTQQCGDVCHQYPIGDINQDCIVNLYDIALLAENLIIDY